MASLVWKYVLPLDSPLASLAAYNAGVPSDGTFATDVRDGYELKSLFSYNATDTENIQTFYPLLFKCKGLYPIALEVSGDAVQYDCEDGGLVLVRHESDAIERIRLCSNPEMFASLGL